MSVKTCFKCNEEKDISNFYKHAGMKDGHLNKCKSCTKKDTDKYAVNNVEKVNKYKRKWANNNKVAKSASIVKYRELNPVKYKAHNIVNNALRDKKLVKSLSCECCGIFTESLHAHHCDYSKPLELLWLCSPCHKTWHRNNNSIGG